jgi:predicted DNA-binding transcriptional regulator AlpA
MTETLHLTLTLEEVAEALSMSATTFRTRKRALEAEGFPRSLPAAGPRWSRRQVEAWIQAGGVSQADPQLADVTDLDAIATARAALQARYSGRAA